MTDEVLASIYGIRPGRHLYYFRCTKIDEDLYEHRSDATCSEDIAQEVAEELWREGRHDGTFEVEEGETFVITLCDENKQKIEDVYITARFNVPVFYPELECDREGS